jgi:hypothetical protein
MDNQTKNPHRSPSDSIVDDSSSGKRKVLEYPSQPSSPGKRKKLKYPEENRQLFWKRLNPPLAALMLLGLFVAVGAVALSAIFLPTFPLLRLAPLPTEVAAGPAPTEKLAITEGPAALPSLPSATPIPHIPTPTESATPRPPTATLTLTPIPTATATTPPGCNDKDNKLIRTPPPPCSYTVQEEGESLSRIAQKVYGDAGCYIYICDANGIERGGDCNDYTTHQDDVYVLPECVR